ncbi:MAG: hypothetical protein ABEK59_11425 [Halobacteria archaeon]
MKATIYINRQILKQNKKQSKALGEIVDRPAIAVRTYKGVEYTKEVDFGNARLVQDAQNPICSGATIWIESRYEELEFLDMSDDGTEVA